MNILWILADALRPANMSCFGYRKPTTPHCDRIAGEGVRFDACISTASHTLPPIVSMLMGQTAATHGIVDANRFTEWSAGSWKGALTPLRILGQQGYLIDGELVRRWAPLGFTRDTASGEIEQYFENHREERWFFYAEPYPTHLPYNPPEEYFRMFLEPGYEIRAETSQRIAVIKKHLIVHPSGVISKLEAGEEDPLPDSDASAAHRRSAGTVDLLAQDRPAIEALYDGEVRVFDDLVGQWFAKLNELDILDETLIIITADHGEELMERGHVGHCSCNLKGTLFDESIRVPLIMRFPRKLPARRVVDQQVSHIDIMPTLFDLLGLPIPAFMEGSSLLPLIDGDSTAFREAAYCQTTPAGWQALASDDREIYAIRTTSWKLILNTDAQRSMRKFELYNLCTDPGETRNLAGEEPKVVSRLKPQLDSYVDRAGK